MNEAQETKFLSLNLCNYNRMRFQVIGQKSTRGMQSKLAAQELGNQDTPSNSSALQTIAAEGRECVSDILCFVWEKDCTQYSLTWGLILGVLDVTAAPKGSNGVWYSLQPIWWEVGKTHLKPLWSENKCKINNITGMTFWLRPFTLVWGSISNSRHM